MFEEFNKKKCYKSSVPSLLLVAFGFLLPSSLSFADKDSGENLDVISREEIVDEPNVKRDLNPKKEDVSRAAYLPYLQLGGTHFFGKRKESKGAFGADLLVPLLQSSKWLIFTDLRVYDRTGSPFEGGKCSFGISQAIS